MAKRIPTTQAPGETGLQAEDPNTFKGAGIEDQYAEGCEHNPEPRWHGGYHDHGYVGGVLSGGPPHAEPRGPKP